MKKIYLIGGLLLGLAMAASAQKNVILYIGDGFGIAPKTAARMALGQGQTGKRFSTDAGFHVLALDKLRYQGSVTTHSLNSWITDSAPGAFVYASGQAGKGDNEVLSLDAVSKLPIETILEKAKKAGMAVGVVSTARITHATPATFYAHVWLRDLESYIAAQSISKTNDEYLAIYSSVSGYNTTYSEARDWSLPSTKVGVEVDVILGGGAQFYFNKISPNNTIVGVGGVPIVVTTPGLTNKLITSGRADLADLVEVAKTRGYQYVNSRESLLALDYSMFNTTSTSKLLGLFHNSHMSYEQDRQLYKPWEPSLEDMTKVAIEILKRKGGDKGFFLMVESGRIDHLGHANAGGLSIISGSQKGIIKADSTANPDGLFGGTGTQAEVYGSDYMIKEVVAFDHAIEVGRQFLNTSAGSTLVLSTSDHECGGFAVVALHDEADLQANGTKMRTYAAAVSQTVNGTVTSTIANPNGTIIRGDNGDNGWYPQYEMFNFQGSMYPRPTSSTAKRIVVSYGSNPRTNGSSVLTGTAGVGFGAGGNHTPQDVMIYADDNVGGAAASKITGRGQLDNTDLHPIMSDFLFSGATYVKENLAVVTVTSSVTGVSEVASVVPFTLYPNPVYDMLNIRLNTVEASKIIITIFDLTGKALFTTSELTSVQNNVYQLPVAGTLVNGYYLVKVMLGDKIYTTKVLKQ